MATSKAWYLITYDIRDPQRWRRAYKVIRGFGERVQYSVFRARLSAVQLARLRWALERILTREDDLLFIPLCDRCVDGIASRNRSQAWPEAPGTFAVVECGSRDHGSSAVDGPGPRRRR
jgi:CRISPR-associated protein Cas2